MNHAQNYAILYTEDISVGYGNGSVLKNIHAEFIRNKVTALMGPSGCGKSTFLRVLNRTLELTPGAVVKTGKVYYHGRDMYAPETDAQSIRTRIGIVQQRPLPFPMSIRENVLFGARFHKKVNKQNRKDYARKLLEKTGLWEEVADRLDSPAGGLSIGQQQRLCIARSLANEPEILLMDEPCSALDPAATAKIENLIQKLKTDLSVIIVTHNIAQARRLADHCLFMIGGALVETGSAAEVLDQPRHPAVKAILSGQEG